MTPCEWGTGGVQAKSHLKMCVLVQIKLGKYQHDQLRLPADSLVSMMTQL